MPTHLSEDEYKATMGSERVGVELGEAPPFDFWPYHLVDLNRLYGLT